MDTKIFPSTDSQNKMNHDFCNSIVLERIMVGVYDVHDQELIFAVKIMKCSNSKSQNNMKRCLGYINLLERTPL